MANNVDEYVPHCELEPCWEMYPGLITIQAVTACESNESLTQILHDTYKINRLTVNILLIICALHCGVVAHCALGC